MKGLRTQENNEFLKFFKLVQDEATKLGSVFFCDCGLGDVYRSQNIECEDLCGWLIPNEKAHDFESIFLENSEKQHDYDDFYTRIDFNIDGDTILLIFN